MRNRSFTMVTRSETYSQKDVVVSEGSQAANDLIEASVDVQQVFVDRHLHALYPPLSWGRSAETAVADGSQGPSRFGVMVQSPGAALPRSHDMLTLSRP